MWLGYTEPLGGAGNNFQYFVTNGAADLPTLAPAGMKVGDRVANLAGTGTLHWRVTASSAANVPTFQSGSPPATRSVSSTSPAAQLTVSPSDGTIMVTGTAAVTITLPAPASFPVGQTVTVINTSTAVATIAGSPLASTVSTTLAAGATGKYATDGITWYNG